MYLCTKEEVAERLAQLPISTEDSRAIMEYIEGADQYIKELQKRLDHAANMIGYREIIDTMIEEDYDN